MKKELNLHFVMNEEKSMKRNTFRLSIISIVSLFLYGCASHFGSREYIELIPAEPSSNCEVIRSYSLTALKDTIDVLNGNFLEYTDNKLVFLGYSDFSTAHGHLFDKKEAKRICKLRGGDYMLVLNKGYEGSSYSQITLTDYQTIHSNTNTNYYSNNGRIGSSYSSTSYSIPTAQTYTIRHDWDGFVYYIFKLVPKEFDESKYRYID
jgi:hypothetical protein